MVENTEGTIANGQSREKTLVYRNLSGSLLTDYRESNNKNQKTSSSESDNLI
jgi:hypothetical protein